MIRNLKVLGLSLVAVFAMSAMVASAASAGELTSDGPVDLHATENPAVLTAIAGQKVECHATYTIGNVNETPHATFITLPKANLTVTPDYTNCVSVIGELKAPLTVTMNGCDFVLHIGAQLEAGKYSGTADVVCEGSNQIEVHAYSSAAHSSTVCTYKIPAQTGLTGGFVKNAAGKVELGGPVTGIKATRTGILCGGTAETKEAKQDIGVVVSGTNEAGAATNIEVTGS